MLKNFFSFFIISTIVFTIYANLINYSNISKNEFSTLESNTPFYFVSDTDKLFWPIPGYHTISSPFGSRISPITKKLSSHSGIDIGAQEGSFLYSASDGKIDFTGFNGANGYSIHIVSGNLSFIYGHVSPNFIVSTR